MNGPKNICDRDLKFINKIELKINVKNEIETNFEVYKYILRKR